MVSCLYNEEIIDIIFACTKESCVQVLCSDPHLVRPCISPNPESHSFSCPVTLQHLLSCFPHKNDTNYEIMTINYTLCSFCKDKLAKITNNQPDRNIQLAQVIDLIKMSSASTSGLASSGILDGKVPVFVFPVQLDFYYEDQTTHKRVVTIYNPYEFDVTFKVIWKSKMMMKETSIILGSVQ